MSQDSTYRPKGKIRTLTGETDIDISAGDYTAFLPLLTITPDSGRALRDVTVFLDLAKATTGFAAGHSTETIQFAVSRKVDGTNWRREASVPATALTGTLAALRMQKIAVGDVNSGESVRIEVILSAEAADTEFPYVITYQGEDPTVTAVAA